MKLFKNSVEDILDRIDELETTLIQKIDTKVTEREKRLEEMFFNAKAHKIAEYENVLKLKNQQLECKDKVIEQQQKEIEKLKKGVIDNGRKNKLK